MKKFLFLFFLASCTLHPRYERPFIESTATWRTPLQAESAVDIDWWKTFQDPVLDKLIEEALANNQDLQVAIARVDQFQAQLGVARAKLYPQIQLDALSNRQKISDTITALPTGVQKVFNAFGFLFKASYLIDLWGEVRSGAEAAYHEWLSSIEARRLAILGLVTSVANTYLQLRQCDAQLIISQKTLDDRKQSCNLAQVRFDLGLTSQMPVEQAASEVEIAQAQVDQFQILIAETENLLSVLLGKPSGPIERGLELDQLCMPPAVPTYLPSDIVNQRPDVRAAEEKLIAAGARIGVAKAKFFPQFSLTGAFGYESVQFPNLLSNAAKIWEYGGDILQEIFTGGRLTSGLKLSEAVQKEMLHQYLSTVLNAFKEVNDALTTHKIDLELVQTQKLRLDALANYLKLSDLRYKEGQTDYLTYLDAERQFFRGQLDYEEAKGASFISLVQIYEALGGSWVIQIDEHNQYYNKQ